MEVPKYTFPLTLIPGGCPQFLDFVFKLDEYSKTLKIVRSFQEEPRQESGLEGERRNFILNCLEDDEDGNWFEVIHHKPIPMPSYDVQAKRSLEPFYGKWIPLPVQRMKEQTLSDGSPVFEEGPSNWARCYVVSPKDSDDTIQIAIAFDTTVENQDTEGEQYCALNPRDVGANATFGLAWHVRDNGWLLNESWVAEWLLHIYEEWLKNSKKFSDDSEFHLVHMAYYLTFLELLHFLLPSDFKIKVINPLCETPIDVDLILDLGNSRTTGILVETLPQRMTNLNDSYLLQIRDLSKPGAVYEEPFATRVEFSEAFFGNEALSRRSGRSTPAFVWPSSVRMGPEAARLSTLARCAEGTTGMSSPKRYLWDERPWKTTWRYNTQGGYEPMVTRGNFAQQVNREGTPLVCFDDPEVLGNKILKAQEREVAFESLFTRSSIMMFLLAEILMHALVTINSPAQRSRRELPALPRRLRRIIFTVPSGMPVAEQRIYRRWVRFAVRALWEALGWQEWYIPPSKGKTVPMQSTDYRLSPESRCSWDEATCTQLVYLYNEISRKFQGDAHDFFEIVGKKRIDYSPYHTMRVASLDIGGGTTDLSIATFSLSNDRSTTARIIPHLDLRDGFNIAGDDIVKAVISDHICPALEQAISEAGVANPRMFMAEQLGRDVMSQTQESKNMRARFTQQVLLPVAYGLLCCYEQSDPIKDSPINFTLADFFQEENVNDTYSYFSASQAPSKAVVKYFEDTVKKYSSNVNFSLFTTPVSMDPKRVDLSIKKVMGPVLTNLCEVIYKYNCDILLLTGRPSRLSGLIQEVISKIPLPVDRIIPMCEYRVGAWYPFANVMGQIKDPKTTVAVGAILCALAEGHLEGFSFDTKRLTLCPTANYIGEMNINSQIKTSMVWFEVNEESYATMELQHDVLMSTPIPVGFRQFPVERWPTTRFYLVDFTTEEHRRQATGNLPFKLKMTLALRDLETTAAGELDEGELSVTEIEDCHGKNLRRDIVSVRLQTLPLDEGYWLDTGKVFNE
jgi:hypothetical protein